MVSNNMLTWDEDRCNPLSMPEKCSSVAHRTCSVKLAMYIKYHQNIFIEQEKVET